MANDDESATYRSIIDELAEACRRGNGQHARVRVLEGVWHRHVESIRGNEELATQMRKVNTVLAGLDLAQREVVAWLLDQQYVEGVHDTLVRLHEAAIRPFDKGYWDPHHDLMSRLDGWDWPVDQERG